MRALRVVGLGMDGRTVILETVAARSGERRERFTLPVDESLHAAVRGDLPRLGQIEIELESQMRPREIQDRIRAGASVEQVAAAAGVPIQRIDRFAYPVLFERSRTAELARRAHPVRSDGPDVRTLDDVVTDTFRSRGHDLDSVAWDSWRGDTGKWVVQLRWRAGRSENTAHWAFHPGAHGGTVTALDEHATDLIDPQTTPLRTVRPLDGGAAVEPVSDEFDGPAYDAVFTSGTTVTTPDAEHARAADTVEPSALAVPDDRVTSWPPRPVEQRPQPVEQRPQPAEPTRPSIDESTIEPWQRGPETGRTVEPPTEAADVAGESPADDPGTTEPGTAADTADVEGTATAENASAVSESATADEATADEHDDAPETLPIPDADQQIRPAPPRKSRKSKKPVMPSWEDVLLGVRSPRE